MIAYTWKANLFYDYLRVIVTCLDRAAFALLNNVYMLFFNVAESNFIPGSLVSSFFSRIQLLIGIFVMFQLAVTIIKGIVTPDSFTNEKTGGAKVITRIVVGLVMLMLMVPINITSPKNTYEKQINNKGILFGTLDELQYRILQQHTIEKLIFGKDFTAESNLASADPQKRYEALKNFSNKMGSKLARTFYTVSMVEEPRTDGQPRDPNNPDDRKCKDMNGIYDKWKDPNTPATELLDYVIVTTCQYKGDEVYAFDIMFVIPCIAGFAMVWIMLSLTFEVAVRAVKLAFLRLIAPIPIISYMNPKDSKDGAFHSWVKLLGTTYIELFIKLIVIYFVLNIAQSLTVDNMAFGLYIDYFQNVQLSGITWFAFIMGLLIFAKDADKFVKQALGLKDNGGKFFSAIGQAMGIGATVASTPGNFMAGMRASRMADETRKAYGENVNPNSAFNRAKHLLAGIAGGVTGVGVGARATLTAKDHYAGAAWDAMQKRNAAALARGNDGSTLFGRARSTISSAITGEGMSGAMEREMATNKARISALKDVQSRAKGEMVKMNWTMGEARAKDPTAVGGWSYLTDTAGVRVGSVNYKDFMARKNAAASSGLDQFDINTSTGVRTITMADANRFEGAIQKENEDDYIKRNLAGTAASTDSKLLTLISYANQLGGAASFTRDAEGNMTKVGDEKISHANGSGRSSVWDSIEDLEQYNTYLDRKNTINKANDRHSKDKK